MATQRFISTSFWDDEWVQTLDPSEKLLYLYLMTNPLTTIAGVYEITVRRMCFDTGFNTDTIKHILGKFEKSKKAFHHNGYIVIPAWPQHQKAETRPKIKEGIDAIINKLPKEMVEYIISVGYRYDIGTYTYVRNYSDSDSDIDSDIDTESELEREKAPAAPSPVPQVKRFVKPTLEEVALYCKERRNAVSAQAFLSFYESNGWKVGKNAMKDWKAAVRTWEQRDDRKPSYQPERKEVDYQVFTAPENDDDLASPEEIAAALAKMPVKRFA